jgi:hypothetical protein
MPEGSSPCRRPPSKAEWSSVIVPVALSQVMTEPCSEKKVTSLSTSVMAGTLSSRTGASVSSVAQRMGSAEFLLPDGVMVPERGLPPLTMRSAIEKEVVGWEGEVESLNREASRSPS